MNEPNMDTVIGLFALCSWGNSTEKPEDWFRILQDNDEQAKARLFKRAFLETPNGLLIKAVFFRRTD